MRLAAYIARSLADAGAQHVICVERRCTLGDSDVRELNCLFHGDVGSNPRRGDDVSVFLARSIGSSRRRYWLQRLQLKVAVGSTGLRHTLKLLPERGRVTLLVYLFMLCCVSICRFDLRLMRPLLHGDHDVSFTIARAVVGAPIAPVNLSPPLPFVIYHPCRCCIVARKCGPRVSLLRRRRRCLMTGPACCSTSVCLLQYLLSLCPLL